MSFDKETARLRQLADRPAEPPIKIETDSRTVWVNGEYCLGRFCRYGFDVFADPEDFDTRQLAGKISHDGMTVEHWRQWQEAMLRHYNVTVSDAYRPDWLTV